VPLKLFSGGKKITPSPDDSNLNRHYVIRDSDCDGIFDERYGLDEEYHLPDCLQQVK
jgi:hypothetical protein